MCQVLLQAGAQESLVVLIPVSKRTFADFQFIIQQLQTKYYQKAPRCTVQRYRFVNKQNAGETETINISKQLCTTVLF